MLKIKNYKFIRNKGVLSKMKWRFKRLVIKGFLVCFVVFYKEIWMLV